MPDNNKGNPMNNGTGHGNNGVDIASIIYEIFQHLDKNTKSYTDQLRVLVNEIKSVSRGDSKSGTNSPTSGFSGRRRTFDYDDIYDNAKDISEMFKRLQKEIKADHRELLSSSEDFKRDLSKLDVKDLETILTKKQIEIAKKYADLQENALKHYEQEITEIESRILTEEEKDNLKRLRSKKESAEAMYNDSLREEKGYTEEQKSNFKQYLEEATKELEDLTEQLSPKTDKGKKEAAEKARKKYEEEQRELNEKERAEKASVEPIKAEFDKDSLKEAMGTIESLKSQSPYLNDKLDDKQTEFEKFEENRKEQLKLLERAGKTLDAYEEKIRQDRENGNITEEELKEQLETIDKQKKNIEDAKKAIEEWSPVKDVLYKAGKDLTSYAKNMIKNIAKFGFGYFEEKYLTSYKDGFEKVYQSVENTRNQISARSKLDQGAFSDMQSEIQDQIEQQGLETVVSQADVNEALISLSSAGITDKELLKTLALEQAKLSASGSSLKLDNEETLQRFQEYIGNESAKGRNYEEILSDIPNLMSEIMNYEGQIRDEFGNDIALMGGNQNKILNEILDITNTAGKSFADASKDIGAAMTYGQAQFNMGLDPDTIMSALRELEKSGITELSTFGKVLLTDKGISAEALRSGEMSIQDAFASIADEMESLLSDKDPKYMKEVLNAFGISSMDPNQAIKFLRGGGLGDVNVASQQELQAQKAQRDAANKAGSYYSATQNHQKYAENFMAETAIQMEKIYKGDEIIKEGFNEITGLTDIVGGAFSDAVSSMMESVLDQTGMSDFLKGEGSAGNIGKGIGAAVGAGIMTYSAINNAKQAESVGDAFASTFTDPTFYGGLGTTLGSAIAGPIGGAIGGAIGTLTSNIGNWLADEVLFQDLQDPIQDAANTLIDAANQQIDAANQQIDAINKQINEYATWGKERKKLELIEKGILSKEEANKLTEEQINALFNDNIINQKQNILDEQNNIIKQQELIKKQASDASAFNEEAKYFSGADKAAYDQAMSLSGGELMYLATQNMNFDETEKKTDEWKAIAEQMKESGASQDEIEKAMKEFWIKLGPNAEVVQNYENLTKSYVGMMGGAESASTVLSDLEDIEKKSDDDLKKYLVSTGSFSESDISDMTTDELVKNAIVERQKERGLTDLTAQDIELKQLEQWKQRKEKYEEADKKFQSKWDNFISKNNLDPKQNLQEALSAYATEYTLPAAFVDSTFMSSDGTVHLDTDHEWYKDEYIEGQHFKTGLTEVPYDEYPALLHKGERILTKEEAEAYNMISSNAVQQYFGRTNSLINDSSIYDSLSSYILTNLEDNIYNNSSSSVLSTRQYGTDNVEQSINNQTTSLSEILNQILEVIKNLNLTIMSAGQSGISKSRYNVLRGNSSIAQINTL